MRSSRTKTVFVGLVLLAVLTTLPSLDVWSMGSRVPTVGMQAEDFQLADLDGKTQSLSQYRGKIVLVNFWATWCKPCTTEVPVMQAISRRLFHLLGGLTASACAPSAAPVPKNPP